MFMSFVHFIRKAELLYECYGKKVSPTNTKEGSAGKWKQSEMEILIDPIKIVL